MFELKPSRPPEGNKSKIPTDRNKGKSSKINKYRGKKPNKNPNPEPEYKTDL